MPHLHEKIDFTVAIFVVYDGKILLIHHRQLDKWLPLGGHIELDEDPERAALREAKEESGLDVELLGERPPTTGPGTRALIAPRFLDIHRINATHEHIGMIYWARPKVGPRCRAASDDQPVLRSNTAKDGQVVPTTPALAVAEHHDIRWSSAADLDKLQPPMSDAVKWYCRAAIREISSQP
jgi:8-oxo-dGTP pyrophosphatase MutT (NUDIX family)